MPDSVPVSPSDFCIAIKRTAAEKGFLQRKLLKVMWSAGLPVPYSRPWLRQVAEAELDWATAEWKNLTHFNGWNHEATFQSQAYRLPHEQAAARVLNALTHCGADAPRLRDLLLSIKEYQGLAWNMTQSPVDRLRWAGMAGEARAAYRALLVLHRRAFMAFLAAKREYRQLREQIDAPPPLSFRTSEGEVWREEEGMVVT